MRASDGRLERILVALDTSAHGRAALEAAARLAADLEAELLGLFVEDANLLRLAGLPFARQAMTAPAREEPLEEDRMARALRAEAEQLRRALAAEATRYRIRWSFRVARGAVGQEVLAAAEQVDLVVLGSAGRNPRTGTGLGSTARTLARQAPHSVAFLNAGAAAGRPVVALYDGTPRAELALAIAARLAREDHQNLVVLVPTTLLPADLERVTAALASRLTALGVRARVLRAAVADAETLAGMVRATGGRLLVLPAGHALAGEETLAQLLGRAGCPVVLAR
jgi:nucleotide-binding universal stress UspA family protein